LTQPVWEVRGEKKLTYNGSEEDKNDEVIELKSAAE
jgi:hypothetical protein